MDLGSYPLTSVAKLPNVTVAFPGERWSNAKASEVIVPGEAVVPINSGGKLYMRVAEATDPITQVSIASRTVQHPDVNTGPGGLGPNEIVNQAIPVGEWVMYHRSGAFHITLVVPAAYLPGELIGWDADGARPAGKGGVGAWAKNAAADIDSVFEVIEFRPVNALNEGILTVKSLRGQF